MVRRLLGKRKCQAGQKRIMLNKLETTIKCVSRIRPACRVGIFSIVCCLSDPRERLALRLRGNLLIKKKSPELRSELERCRVVVCPKNKCLPHTLGEKAKRSSLDWASGTSSYRTIGGGLAGGQRSNSNHIQTATETRWVEARHRHLTSSGHGSRRGHVPRLTGRRVVR